MCVIDEIGIFLTLQLGTGVCLGEGLSGHWSVKSAMGKSFDIMLLGCFFILIKYKGSAFSLIYITKNLPRFDRPNLL